MLPGGGGIFALAGTKATPITPAQNEALAMLPIIFGPTLLMTAPRSVRNGATLWQT